MKYKKLVISPHIDDEVLSCGGILDENTFVLECGVDNFHIVSRCTPNCFNFRVTKF